MIACDMEIGQGLGAEDENTGEYFVKIGCNLSEKFCFEWLT